jgi:glutamyl-tRNA reductase
MQRLHLLGLNHTTAPLEVREKLAFNPEQRARAMAAFHQQFPQCEAVLLSTCNRVELYVAREVHGHPRAEDVAAFLSGFHAVPVDAVQPHLYHQSGREMVEHLFNVAASLDSMVLGETQILGQVREAYEAAREQACVGSMLNPLFQRAIAVGKQVMRETPLAEGRVSIASVAVDYAGRIFDHYDDKKVLCIGAGKMAQLVLRSFSALSPKKLLVCNRDGAKAAALALQFNGESADFAALDEHLASVDVVITSTGSTDPIITAKRFLAAHRKRRYKPIFIIDIALPRDVEAAVGEIENVYLYNLDDLQKVVSQTHAGRQASIDSASKIVAAAVEEYLRAHRVRSLGPVIDQLYKRYHQLAREELNRTLAKLQGVSDQEKSHLEELARRIVNKLLHDPVQALRTADEAHTPVSQYVHAMERLFKLSEKSDAAPPSDEPQPQGLGDAQD